MMIEIGGHSFELGKKYKLSYNNNSKNSTSAKSSHHAEEINEKVVLLQYKFKPVEVDRRGEGQITTSSSTEVNIRLPILSNQADEDGKNDEKDDNDNNSDDKLNEFMSFKGTIAEQIHSNEYILSVQPSALSSTSVSKDHLNDSIDQGNNSSNDDCCFELSKVTTVVSGIRHVRSAGTTSIKRKQPVVVTSTDELVNDVTNSNNIEESSKTKGVKRKGKERKQ